MKQTDYRRYYQVMSQLIRKLNLLNKEEKVCYGLTLPQCYAIEALGSGQKLTMKELSYNLGVTISTMTRVVDILAREGLVKRGNNPRDRRKVWVELTEKGGEIEVKLKACSDKYSQAILNEIPANKRITVLESLELLSQAIDGIKNRKCCLPALEGEANGNKQ